jgi:biopolymer transport protein ExbB
MIRTATGSDARPGPRGVAGLASVATLVVLGGAQAAAAQEAAAPAGNLLDVRELLAAGGTIGLVIIALSVAMVALVLEHLLSIRRLILMPPGLAERLHREITEGRYPGAEALCRQQPSFLAHLAAAGLQEVSLGYGAVEKAMEDAAHEQAARLYRKIEYLSVISALAPMLGLMGTVWGMILAFGEFSQKANPLPADFAPGISAALVTTLFGLGVAIPALAAFAYFRNRIDELVAETSLLAEQVFQNYKLGGAHRRRSTDGSDSGLPPERRANRPAVPPLPSEREAVP